MSNTINKDTKFEELELPRTTGEEIVWKINFSANNFTHVAKWTYDEIVRITRYASNVDLPTEEEISKYLTTLTYCRVQSSLGERLPGGYKPTHLRRLFVPARFASLLSMIGEVYYPDVAVRLLPSTNIAETEILTVEEVMIISQKLERFFEDGFCGTMGISLDRYGDPHFMNKVAIIEGKPQGCIKSMTKDNPLYGFFAWLMNSELLEVAYSEARILMRINYSEPTVYNSVARRVWNKFETSTGPDTKNNENPYKDGIANILNEDK